MLLPGVVGVDIELVSGRFTRLHGYGASWRVVRLVPSRVVLITPCTNLGRAEKGREMMF